MFTKLGTGLGKKFSRHGGSTRFFILTSLKHAATRSIVAAYKRGPSNPGYIRVERKVTNVVTVNMRNNV